MDMVFLTGVVTDGGARGGPLANRVKTKRVKAKRELKTARAVAGAPVERAALITWRRDR
jgi:hypothetical protein